MRRLRDKLSYANVMATFAVFLALGGGAYAATQLKKNSVGSKQLKTNAVTSTKIGKEAVTTEKLKAGSVTAVKLANSSVGAAQLQPNSISAGNVQPGSLTGTQINQSTLTSVRASNVIGIALTGLCGAVAPLPSGVSAEVVGTGCKVTFPFSVLDCAVTATVDLRFHGLIIVETRTVQTLRDPTAPDALITDPAGNGAPKAEPVDLTIVC